MGKSGWMHTIKKAVHNHLVGDIDPHKFSHLPGPSRGTTPRAQNDREGSSSASSHVVDLQQNERRRSSASVQAVGESHYYEQEENSRRRSSTSSQTRCDGSGYHEKSPKHDTARNRSDISLSQANVESYDSAPSSSRMSEKGSRHHNHSDENGSEHLVIEESYKDSRKPRREKSSGDHGHLVKLYREERAGGSTSSNPFYDRSNKEDKGRSEKLSASSANENPRFTGGGGAAADEKRRPNTSFQKERSAHDKSPLEKGRSSNASSQQHNERPVLEKVISSTPSKSATSSLSSAENFKAPSENRRQSTDKGCPKTPSSPRIAQQAPVEKTKWDKGRSTQGPTNSQQQQQRVTSTTPPAGQYSQLGRSVALQDLLKPPSLERKSSSSSTTSVSQGGGSARSITSEFSNTSEEFSELVQPLPDTTRTSPSRSPVPYVSSNQRRKVAIATIQEIFSSHEYEAPVSPASQRRKSGNFTNKNAVPLSEHGTKPLLPPDYRKQQPAVAVADLGAVVFHAGDAGVGGMLGEWAAVLIQSSWRGYITRKAFKALRGLVKLQALARGYLVRQKIGPLVNARIQAARVRRKLNQNTKVQLYPISNGYGIAQTVLENRPFQYGFAQPVLEDSRTPTARKSSKPRETLTSDISDWNKPVVHYCRP